MTLEEKLSAAEARLVALEQQLQAAATEKETLSQRLAEAEALHGEESSVVSQLQAELKQTRQQNTDLSAKVAQLEQAQQSAEARAAEICASVGVEPLPVTPRGDQQPQDLVEELKAQKTPAAQTAFWRKNKHAIIRNADSGRRNPRG